MPVQNDDGFSIKPSIPQLFYDVIARIVPGAVIIGLLASAAVGPARSARFIEEWLNKPVEKYPSIVVMVGFGFVLSYTVSILFLGLWNVVSHVLPKPVRSSAWNDEFPMKYDYIKCFDPVAGSRITKLTAEKHMAGILTLGLTLSLLITIIKIVWSWSFDLSVLLFALVLVCGITGSLGAFSHFVERQNYAINNYAQLLDFEAWKKEPAQRIVNSREPQSTAQPENRNKASSNIAGAVRS